MVNKAKQILEQPCGAGGMLASRSAERRTQLEALKEAVTLYEMAKEKDLFSDQPTYTLIFIFKPLNLKCEDPSQSSPPALPVPLVPQPRSVPALRVPQPRSPPNRIPSQFQDDSDNEDDSYSSNPDSNWNGTDIDAAYNVDLLASDGRNVFYTSYFDDGLDLIAYCYLDGDSTPDSYREWKQSRILDIVWWDRINAFICATANAVYSVTVENGRFNIRREFGDHWSYVRVATNSEHLWVWVNEKKNDFQGILIYNDAFDLVREIDFDDGLDRIATSNSTSFCLTESCSASISRHTPRNCELLRVEFNGMNMITFRLVNLGRCYGDREIRTDGDDQFFISTGSRKVYIVTADGDKEFLIFQRRCHSLAVVNSQRIVGSNGSRTMELWTC